MKLLITTLLLLCSVAAAQATPFGGGNPEAGKKLFDQYNCNRCHNAKMGGDGNRIFTRINRIVHNPQQLVARLHVCGNATGLEMTHQHEQDLGAYLNKNFYHFK